jgi:hypothetical protein
MNSAHKKNGDERPGRTHGLYVGCFTEQKTRTEGSNQAHGLHPAFIAMAAHNPRSHEADRHAHEHEILAEPLLSTGIGL